MVWDQPKINRLAGIITQIQQLGTQRDTLFKELTSTIPATTPPKEQSAQPQPVFTEQPAFHPTKPSGGFNSQQILLGLGAFLLLCGMSFVLLIAWFIVGPIGQFLIVSAITFGSYKGGVRLEKKGLKSSAETVALVTSGLLALNLTVLYNMILDKVIPESVFNPVAGFVFAGLTLAASGISNKNRPDGTPPYLAYLYVSTGGVFVGLLTAIAPYASNTFYGALATFAAAGFLFAAAAAFYYRFPNVRPEPDFVFTRTGMPVTVLAATTLLCMTGFLITLIEEASGSRYDDPSRWPAIIMLALLGAAVAVAGWASSKTSKVPSLSPLPTYGTAAAILAGSIWAALIITPAEIVALITAFVCVAAVTYTRVYRFPIAKESSPIIHTAASVAALLAPGILTGMVAWCAVSDIETFSTYASSATYGPTYGWVIFAAVAWAISAFTINRIRETDLGVLVSHTAAAVTVAFTALLLANGEYKVDNLLASGLLLLTAATISGAYSAYTAHRPHGSAVTKETVSVMFGTLYTIAAALCFHAELAATTFAIFAVTLFVHAAAPGRIGYAYAGSGFMTITTTIINIEYGNDTPEMFTLPLAAMLAIIGFVLWRRDPSLPTRVTMAAPLTIAFVPTLTIALFNGDLLRYSILIPAAILLLAWGLSSKLRQPVNVAAITLILIGLTETAPYLAELPISLILVAAGATLLTAGIMHEKAVKAGRQASVWYSTLR